MGISYECTLGNCEVTSMVNGVDCDVVLVVAGVVCDDGNGDIKDDVCDADGGCVGVAIVCSEGIVCTFSYSGNGVDCMVNYVFAWMVCDDQNAIIINDVCDGVGSCMGSSSNCPVLEVLCIMSISGDGVDCIVHYAVVGIFCDDIIVMI